MVTNMSIEATAATHFNSYTLALFVLIVVELAIVGSELNLI